MSLFSNSPQLRTDISKQFAFCFHIDDENRDLRRLLESFLVVLNWYKIEFRGMLRASQCHPNVYEICFGVHVYIRTFPFVI